MVSMMVFSASRRAASGMSPGRRPSIQVARLSETVLSAAMTDPSTAELTKAGKVRLAGEALAESEQLLRALPRPAAVGGIGERSEEHTSELQSLMRISYAVFCLKKK